MAASRSSTRVPTRTSPVSIFAGSSARERDSSSASAPIRADRYSCLWRAAWYSKFSDRSPWSLATRIASALAGSSTCRRCASSWRRASIASGVE